jgi:hypothetical protein
MKPRNQRLREALRKFTAEALKPMEMSELAPLMGQFPAGLAERYSQLLIGTIQRNCLDEFDAIIQETNISEKLDLLDGLAARASGFDVSAASFDFKHADPEFVKHAIVRRVKQREVLLLRGMREDLERENARLAERDRAAAERLRRVERQIEDARKQIGSE